jgi:hypothetical protein
MVEVARAVNYKVLSWDGITGSSAYIAKSRGLEVLKAHEKVAEVSERQWWDDNCTKPGHTPTLHEQFPYRGLSCAALVMKMRSERLESAARRKGVKVDQPIPVESWTKAVIQ